MRGVDDIVTRGDSAALWCNPTVRRLAPRPLDADADRQDIGLRRSRGFPKCHVAERAALACRSNSTVTTVDNTTIDVHALMFQAVGTGLAFGRSEGVSPLA